MAPDVLRCDPGTNNYAFATLFRHTAADPVVGFNIFMYRNCVSNQRMTGNAEASGITMLDMLFKELRDTGYFQDTSPFLC